MSAPGRQGGRGGLGSHGEQTKSDVLHAAHDTSMKTTIRGSTFSHLPLNLTTDQLRLLILLPGPRTAPIECKIIIATLGGHHSYEALSYCWGSPNPTKTITVDEQDFVVRENLWQALYHLRCITAERVLWVDAICIDQSNIKERNHQVEQMGQVYEKATEVLVWLGAYTEGQTGIGRLSQDPLTAPDVQQILENPLRPRPEQTSMTWPAEHTDRDFKQLCSSEYWNRLWVIQEVILARNITIHFGFRSATWAAFIQMYTRTGRTGIPILLDYHRREHLNLNTSKPGVPWSRFQSLLEDFGGSLCEEPRDKLFGFLGIAKDLSTKDIKVDYEASLLDLCNQVSCRYPPLGRLLHRIWGVEIESSWLGEWEKKWVDNQAEWKRENYP